jgi:uncharacterized protein
MIVKIAWWKHMDEVVSRIIMERNVPATMRDGTVLRADVYRPAKDRKFPVLLGRTPYNKSHLPSAALGLDPLTAAHAGYVVIIQDTRARFESDGGRFYMYRDEFNDGYDSVEWAASLAYSDGNVGMVGVSYHGMTQFQAAVMRPPHLKAIFPITWGTDVFLYRGGAFEMGLLYYWALSVIGPNAVARAMQEYPELHKDFVQLIDTIDHIGDGAYLSLPLIEDAWPELANNFAPFVSDILNHPSYDEYHQNIGVKRKADQVNVPCFCVAGWHDAILGHNLEHFQNIKANGGSEVARKKSRIIISPWAHGAFLHCVGEINYGLASSGYFLDLKRDLTSLQLEWFDYWLKGKENGITDEAPVKIFVMGENKWRDEQEWPLARTQYTQYYFRSKGNANTKRGDGFLSTKPPGDEAPDRFVYDPRDPVPTLGGNILLPMNYTKGPVDQQFLEEREDILIYRTQPLEKDVEVTGPITVRLYAASSARDTDFTAKLIDVYPDGKTYNLADGIIRARYRNGSETQALIQPEEIYEYNIDLWATSNLFKAGHRIGVEISSSNFPRFDRNTNTGKLGRDSSDMAVAKQTVYHDGRYPSHIVLPVIPR